MADVTVEVQEGTFDKAGEVYEEGEQFELDEELAADFPRTLQVVDDAATDAEDGDEDGVDAPFDPAEFTIEELEEKVAETDLSDEEREALIEAEEAGENRDGALDVLQE